jgi:D-aminopeptidase
MRIGRLQSGPLDAITDVAGVKVGHATIATGDLQTGVTVIVPRDGDPYLAKPRAAAEVINGFGKAAGLMQLEELGVIETPIALTNTFGVGTVSNAQIRAALAAHREIGREMPTVDPVTLECNDGFLNDIQAMAVEERHYDAALAAATTRFARGCVGAGRGMSMFTVKGGIGTASRRAEEFTVGALVLANFGRAPNLILAGRRVGPELERRLAAAPAPESGSIIMVLATDAPLEHRQLRRLARRAAAGLARTGSFYGHGSGDIALAFSTANPVSHQRRDGEKVTFLHETRMDPLFHAAADATEQAIVDALFSAETVRGFRGHVRRAFLEVFPDWQSVKEAM